VARVFMGIDPGKSGAICALSIRDTENIAVTFAKMPLNKDGEVCAYGLTQVIKQIRPDKVMIEKVGAMPGQGVTSMFTFGNNYGQIIGVVAALGLTYETARPQEWQKQFHKGQLKTLKPKEKSLKAAKELFPKLSFIPKGCRVAHDGLVDALLLAYYSYSKRGA
jgi:crossover junction endodeoxyribonuclease RuvC